MLRLFSSRMDVAPTSPTAVHSTSPTAMSMSINCLDVADPIEWLHHLFFGTPCPCFAAVDVNDDEVVNIADTGVTPRIPVQFRPRSTFPVPQLRKWSRISDSHRGWMSVNPCQLASCTNFGKITRPDSPPMIRSDNSVACSPIHNFNWKMRWPHSEWHPSPVALGKVGLHCRGFCTADTPIHH